MRTFDRATGKCMVAPINVPEGTFAKPVYPVVARSLIKEFEEHGAYTSCLGCYLWVLVTHCIESGIPHTVEQWDHDGWIVRKTK